ncbi:16S rRNA pseudouridylate synthase [Pseudoalteromonas luteoviolacea CPMOR-1]|uniref:Pseudouridine synthase n=1 Tax=Pseudoalteromonas luteoviolacea CPMOR-1 TaxID=1365248 RepID=A0A167HNG0_9GAMM|nr:16S rRNA pseudouridine(516) synthase RsuA [Pseudoalteromonas luteoviolacea]KZN58325.1 16S rRNA pseudouridylate synthase [Pseudoalteromonas luteoviolacea CPMOR-1]
MKFPCRIDKFVSHINELPRSKVKILIKKGEVTINGVVTKKSDTQINAEDHIEVSGNKLKYLGKRYFMLNKPQGYVCANHDELHPTVFDLIDEPNLKDFHVAGRLDIDTTGLVLITNDGDWSHQITSPKKAKFKTYRVETKEIITEDCLEQLRQGVALHNEKQLTRPALAHALDKYALQLSICEGKYHQVKRMLAAVGNHVVELHREKISEIELDPSLAMGEYRALTQQEVDIINAK